MGVKIFEAQRRESPAADRCGGFGAARALRPGPRVVFDRAPKEPRERPKKNYEHIALTYIYMYICIRIIIHTTIYYMTHDIS